MAGGVRIELPFPSASLFPNNSHGKHWGGKQSDKVKCRSDANWLASAARTAFAFQPNKDRWYGLKVTFCVNVDNKDFDNMLAASKALLDGVAIGLGVNDKQFRPITLDVSKTKGPQMVVVEVVA